MLVYTPTCIYTSMDTHTHAHRQTHSFSCSSRLQICHHGSCSLPFSVSTNRFYLYQPFALTTTVSKHRLAAAQTGLFHSNFDGAQTGHICASGADSQTQVYLPASPHVFRPNAPLVPVSSYHVGGGCLRRVYANRGMLRLPHGVETPPSSMPNKELKTDKTA